jgi:hypothetical protein
MPRQYIFEIWSDGKLPIKLYRTSSDEGRAIRWLIGEGHLRNWGQLDKDWQIKSITSRPLSEVYEHSGDKVGYLCEITEELFARECSNNCPNTNLRDLSWNDLCDGAIEILEALKVRK